MSSSESSSEDGDVDLDWISRPDSDEFEDAIGGLQSSSACQNVDRIVEKSDHRVYVRPEPEPGEGDEGGEQPAPSDEADTPAEERTESTSEEPPEEVPGGEPREEPSAEEPAEAPPAEPEEPLLEGPAEAPAEEPAETPDEESAIAIAIAIATAEEAAEAPAEEAAQEPDEAPAEEAAQEPAEAPAEEAAQEPAEAPAEEAAQEPAVAPSEISAEVPTEESAEAPAEESADISAEEPAETLADEPDETPPEEPDETPADAPPEEPEEVAPPDEPPPEEPADAPSEEPEEPPAEEPVDVPPEEPPEDVQPEEPVDETGDESEQADQGDTGDEVVSRRESFMRSSVQVVQEAVNIGRASFAVIIESLPRAEEARSTGGLMLACLSPLSDVQPEELSQQLHADAASAYAGLLSLLIVMLMTGRSRAMGCAVSMWLSGLAVIHVMVRAVLSDTAVGATLAYCSPPIIVASILSWATGVRGAHAAPLASLAAAWSSLAASRVFVRLSGEHCKCRPLILVCGVVFCTLAALSVL